MAAKTENSTVECVVQRGRIMHDGKIYKKGDTISLPADKVDVHPGVARK